MTGAGTFTKLRPDPRTHEQNHWKSLAPSKIVEIVDLAGQFPQFSGLSTHVVSTRIQHRNSEAGGGFRPPAHACRARTDGAQEGAAEPGDRSRQSTAPEVNRRYIFALTCQYPFGQGTARAAMLRGRAAHGPDARGMPGDPRRPLVCRHGGVTGRTGRVSRRWLQARRRGARRADSIWRVSESFPELAQAVLEHAQPDRIDIVRAKRHLLGQLSDGEPHPSSTLIASVAALLGAEPLGHPQIDLPSRDSVKTVVTADHPVPAAIAADLCAREALAELAADGMLIAAGTGPLAGNDEMMLSFQLPGYAAGQRLRLHRPAVLSDVVRLPQRLRHQGLWGLEPDIFIADLASLGLDLRTERSLREAIESYRRGVFLAASSLLGAAVEGAWHAAGQRLRVTVPQVDPLVDGDRTAQLQGAVAAALRDSLPGNRRWEADALSQFARLMRDIRNYGVHPRQVTDGDIEVYFTEDNAACCSSKPTVTSSTWPRLRPRPSG